MKGQWSRERAWDWYDRHPWFRGCNFMGSDCANRIDQWQALGFEERMVTAERELKLAADTGFNTIRIIPEFIVWDQDHDGFMARFERYIATAWKYGISCMVTFGNDCMPPKDEFWKPLQLGEQHFDWGYHGGRKHSQHQRHNQMGYHLLDEPELAARHYEWVREIIVTYKNDVRICFWDLYNEPGNAHRDVVTLPLLVMLYEIAREIDPIQPVTSAVWRMHGENELCAAEQFVLENSDIVSYHNYGTYDENIAILRRLKRQGRPILNTEWLARMQHNTVEQMFPLFYLEKVGCYNWGFVAGKYQTYEPWNGIWQRWDEGGARDIDFKVWFHDLYRPNLHPYDPNEIELIRRYCKMADEDFAMAKGKES